MRLRFVTAQSAGLDPAQSFSQNYSTSVGDCLAPSWSEPVEKVRRLFLHLEQNVEGPSQWVTISHLIYFYLSDTDDWRPERARVFVHPTSQGYEIKYRSRRELDYWESFTALLGRDEVEAGQLIREALNKAERNLPGR